MLLFGVQTLSKQVREQALVSLECHTMATITAEGRAVREGVAVIVAVMLVSAVGGAQNHSKIELCSLGVCR